MHEFRRLLDRQQGVIARRQVLGCGLDDAFLVRSLRRRELTRIHDGVYVNHTGELSWLQRAWAAVLFYWPAALSHDSVLRVHELRRSDGSTEPIHVLVDHRRRVSRRPGIEVHRTRGLDRLIAPNREPARVRLEHALLDVASAAKDDADAIATLADACQSRKTTAARLAAALRERTKLPRRRFLLEVLDDVATGAYSLLEHRYLTRVERPHGLPTAKRQRRVRTGRSNCYRDVEYLGLATLVELDGRFGHELTRDRWDDLDRDIDSARSGVTTIRLGWKQVQDSCRAAAAVAAMLRLKGWRCFEAVLPLLPDPPGSGRQFVAIRGTISPNQQKQGRCKPSGC